MPKVTAVVSEADLQGAVTDLCTWYGLRWWHDADPRRNKAGLPDLIIVGLKGVLWRELKTDTGRMRPAQAGWAIALDAAGADIAVWRPIDWHSGRIRTELEAIR